MTLLDQLGQPLPERYYLGVDVGYKAHVAAVISLETFVTRGDHWKRAPCLEFLSTQAGLEKLQQHLDSFSPDPHTFLGLCEPTGGFYGATLFQFLLERGYPMLYILPISDVQAISHQAAASEYEQWLEGVELSRTGLVLQTADIASVNDDYSHTLVLAITSDASREIVALVEPDADADHLLSGEYSIACPQALTPDYAFVVRLSGDRVLGGTIRCPTAEVHTHPDMYVTTQIGHVVLRIDNCDQAALERIVSALR